MGQIVFSELLYQFITRDKPIVPGNTFKILKTVDFFPPRYLPNFDMTKDPELQLGVWQIPVICKTAFGLRGLFIWFHFLIEIGFD